MAETSALAQAQALLEELIGAATAGTIIPIRLPDQLEAIKDALAKAEAEAAEEAKKTTIPADQETFLKEQAAFVSHAIHELRTPMTSIRGYSDMLRSMGTLNDMQKMAVDTIRNNSRRMESLLTDVSDTSKIKAGTLRLNVKMDMFKNIAMMVEKLAQPVSEELGRKLTIDVPQGLPILNVDGELLAKALYKLVENGLRYTDNDAKTAEVILRGEADGSKLLITVQDNGIGMTPEELKQLGTIYYRAESELVRGYKGSGLGVPVAYGIIRALGGTTTVTSEPGKGTTYTITLTGMS